MLIVRSFALLVALAALSTPRATAAQTAEQLTLQDAVNLALAANPEVRRAREQVSEFRMRVRATRAGALPKLDLVVSLQQNRDPGLRNSQFFSRLPSLGGPVPSDALGAFHTGTYFYQVELEQPLVQFGRVSHALEAARQETQGVETDVEAVENRVALDVARAYYDLLLARERLSVLAAERAVRERQVRLVRDRLEIGEATRLDRLQAEVSLANLQPEVLTAESSIRVARVRLNETMGRAPHDAFEPAEDLVSPGSPVEPAGLPGLMSLADANRAELRRYELTRRVLQEGEAVVRADLRPEISARASLGINSYKADNLLRPSFHNWTAGITMRWPLFDGHRTGSAVGQLRSQRRQSLLEEETFRARLARDLERASGDLGQARKTIEVATLALEQAREAQRVAEELFNVGAATFLDVLDAERALRQAELARLQAHHAASTALAELKGLVGLRADAPDSVLAQAVTPASDSGAHASSTERHDDNQQIRRTRQ
jgi:outer membrane protein TolC